MASGEWGMGNRSGGAACELRVAGTCSQDMFPILRYCESLQPTTRPPRLTAMELAGRLLVIVNHEIHERHEMNRKTQIITIILFITDL